MTVETTDKRGNQSQSPVISSSISRHFKFDLPAFRFRFSGETISIFRHFKINLPEKSFRGSGPKTTPTPTPAWGVDMPIAGEVGPVHSYGLPCGGIRGVWGIPDADRGGMQPPRRPQPGSGRSGPD